MDRAHLQPADLAVALDMTLNEVRGLISGIAALTPAYAHGLAGVFGGSPHYWLTRDEHFRADVTSVPIERRAEAAWLKTLPYGDLVKFGWLKPSKNEAERAQALLDFFGIQHSAQWPLRYPVAGYGSLFRTSNAFETRHEAVATWLRQGERVAAQIECAPWDRATFRAKLIEARSLTKNRHPAKFFPELRRLCAECGVALVASPTPSGCFASGATQFLNRRKALLMLSFRFKSDDQFWFSFFHEAGHLVLHDIDAVFIDDALNGDSPEEQEANLFAQDLLIPAERRQEMLNLSRRYAEVIRFAVQIGIAPGIVVGQMQKAGILRYQDLNRLKRRFEDEQIQAAFTP